MSETHTPCTVLLLDDDEDDYMLVKSMLHSLYGDTVHLNWFQQDHFSTTMICSGFFTVTLVDYRLGTEDGLAIIRKAKAQCPERNILLLTGWPDDSIAERAQQVGADGYLNKAELSETVLKAALAPWLDCRKVS